MVTTSTSSNQVLMVVSDSWDLSRSSTFFHTSAIEFNESAPFPLVMRFSLFVSGKNTPLIISNGPGKVHTYTNTKYKNFSGLLYRNRQICAILWEI